MPKVKGSGSIVQLDKDKPRSKCRRWQLRVSAGRDLSTGKYRTFLRSFAGTFTQAQQALRDFISEIESGEAKRPSGATVEQYAASWIAFRRADDGISDGTVDKNEAHLKCVVMHLGKARLHELAPKVVERAYSKLMDGESPSGRSLSGSYVLGVHSTLRSMLDDAVSDGLLSGNPCDGARLPKPSTPEKRRLPLDRMKGLSAALDAGSAPAAAVLLCVQTGLRRGEACALSWGDVDLDGRVLYVRHNYDEHRNLKAPKTAKGERKLPLSDGAVDTLKTRRAAQEKAFADIRRSFSFDSGTRTLPSITPETPVVSNDLGERILPHSITRWWERNRSDYGLDDWTLHEMRHSYLSELARRKVDPKVLQELAGHAKYSTTMDIYVHVEMEDKRDAVSDVDW